MSHEGYLNARAGSPLLSVTGHHSVQRSLKFRRSYLIGVGKSRTWKSEKNKLFIFHFISIRTPDLGGILH